MTVDRETRTGQGAIVEGYAEALTGGVTADMVEDAGGIYEFAVGCAEGGCCCEPCSLCEEGKEHDVGHECMDYICLGCDAWEYLQALHEACPGSRWIR